MVGGEYIDVFVIIVDDLEINLCVVCMVCWLYLDVKVLV